MSDEQARREKFMKERAAHLKELGERDIGQNIFIDCGAISTDEVWIACRFEKVSASNVGLSILGVFDDGKSDRVCTRSTDFVIGPLTLNKASLYSFVDVRYPLAESVEGQGDD